MSIIIFIIALAALIFVHELGHFIVAKKSGIRVDEFGIGFPPKLFSFKPKKSETTYSINLLPFGGFVKILGEDPRAPKEELDSKKSLTKKPKWVQALVLIAGVAFNTIFAWILISAGLIFGMPVAVSESNIDIVNNPRVLILEVLPGSPAEKFGLLAGDQILFTESGDSYIQDKNLTVTAFQNIVSKSNGEDVHLIYRRAGESQTAIIEPARDIIDDGYAIGVSISMIGEMKLPVHLALFEGAKFTGVLLKDVTIGFFSFAYKAITGQADFSKVAGPVGIVGLGSEAVKAGFGNLMAFISFISINLVVLNLLPFPALDGGRLLFLLIEKIKGSEINPKVAGVVNMVGFGLLLLLMLLVTYNDIAKLF